MSTVMAGAGGSVPAGNHDNARVRDAHRSIEVVVSFRVVNVMFGSVVAQGTTGAATGAVRGSGSLGGGGGSGSTVANRTEASGAGGGGVEPAQLASATTETPVASLMATAPSEVVCSSVVPVQRELGSAPRFRV